MKQISRVLSTYTADVSGVCSALYEMGGMTIMHDPSGCNSTYNTHDEPRWYDMPSMVYISGLSEYEAVLGDDNKLINDIVEAAEELHPRFVAIAGTPIPMMVGTDFKGIAKILERKLGIPVFGFDTNGMHSYVFGGGIALAAVARRFCEPGVSPARPWGEEPMVNLLGVTPLDFSVNGSVEALKDAFRKRGIGVVGCWAMGSSFEELRKAGKAHVNIVVSAVGLELAKALEALYGTPWVMGIPVGRKLTEEMILAVNKAAETGENQIPVLSTKTEGKAQTYRKVYMIGEWVWAASLRYSLLYEYGFGDVTVICPLEPLESVEGVDEKTMFLPYEDALEAQLSDAELVIADPIYRRILPQGKDVQFIEFPHEGYSGRIYRRQIPVFIEDAWNSWLKTQTGWEA